MIRNWENLTDENLGLSKILELDEIKGSYIVCQNAMGSIKIKVNEEVSYGTIGTTDSHMIMYHDLENVDKQVLEKMQEIEYSVLSIENQNKIQFVSDIRMKIGKADIYEYLIFELIGEYLSEPSAREYIDFISRIHRASSLEQT